jgi:DNA helicase II / ATP-dependent DNA helicase PcrA
MLSLVPSERPSDRAQAEDVTWDQLHLYALDYQELTGESSDLVEVLNLDADQGSTREVVEETGSARGSQGEDRAAAILRRENNLLRHPPGCTVCSAPFFLNT